jgi:FkbM family methyltransferase
MTTSDTANQPLMARLKQKIKQDGVFSVFIKAISYTLKKIRLNVASRTYKLLYKSSNPYKYTSKMRQLRGHNTYLSEQIDMVTSRLQEETADKTSPCVIDCGFNEGVVLNGFHNRLDANKWSFYGFEIQSELYELVSEKFKDHKNVTLYNEAVSVDGGEIEIFISDSYGTNFRGGSTTVPGKVTSDRLHEKRMVKSVDFGQFLLELSKKHDYIFIKMDVEGAEYVLIPHIIKNKNVFDLMVCEFHPACVTKSVHQDTIKSLDQEKLNYIQWV